MFIMKSVKAIQNAFTMETYFVNFDYVLRSITIKILIETHTHQSIPFKCDSKMRNLLKTNKNYFYKYTIIVNGKKVFNQ